MFNIPLLESMRDLLANYPGIVLFLANITMLGVALIVIEIANRMRASKKHKEQKTERFKFANPQEAADRNIVLWDWSTVDCPPPAYLMKIDPIAIYFCTTSGVSPDLTLTRCAAKRASIYHREYRTDRTINLHFGLILTLWHIRTHYGKECNIHVITNEPDLVKRIQIQANGYGIQSVTGKNGDLS